MGQPRGDILLVDDTPDNLRVLSSMLSEQHYKVRCVTSGKVALHVVQHAQPDIILMDVMMPDMDGYQLCATLKADPNYAAIPVIFISALDEVVDKVKAFSVGGVDYITKPFQSQEVLARVNNQLTLLSLRNQLVAQNETLQQEIERRQQAQAELELTLAMRDDLSNMLVHDLRNPVSTIAMISESLLRRNELSDRPREAVNMIQQTAYQLNSLINDLLIVAKMDAGHMLLNRKELDGNQLVAKVVEAMQVIASGRQSELKLQLPPKSRAIAVDANLISRVLDNLMCNAIKYSPAETTVTVALEYLDDADSEAFYQAKIQVIDQGFGMTVEQRQTIFKKFAVGEAVRGVTQVGLGLAFCKLVVEAHGGQIAVEDNQPQGSIFTVTI